MLEYKQSIVGDDMVMGDWGPPKGSKYYGLSCALWKVMMDVEEYGCCGACHHLEHVRIRYRKTPYGAKLFEVCCEVGTICFKDV